MSDVFPHKPNLMLPNRGVTNSGTNKKRYAYRNPAYMEGEEDDASVNEHNAASPSTRVSLPETRYPGVQRGTGNTHSRLSKIKDNTLNIANGSLQSSQISSDSGDSHLSVKIGSTTSSGSEKSTEEVGCPTGLPLQGIPLGLQVIEGIPYQDNFHRRDYKDTSITRRFQQWQGNQEHDDTRRFQSPENPTRSEHADFSPTERLQLQTPHYRREHDDSRPTRRPELEPQISTGIIQNSSPEQHEQEHQPNQQQNVISHDSGQSQQGPGNGNIQSDRRPEHQPGRLDGPRLQGQNQDLRKVHRGHLKTKCAGHLTRRTVCIFFVVLLVAGGIAAAVTLITFPQFYRHTVLAEMRVNDTYDSQMQNTSSPAAQEWGYSFCETLKKTVGEKVAFEKCTIESLLSGSIVAQFRLTLLSGSEFTEDELLALMTASGAMSAHQEMLIFENQHIFKDSLKVFEVVSEVVKKDNVISSTSENPDSSLYETFDCSVKGQTFRPFRDTYPSNCGTFQHCVNGHTSWLLCQSGLEYVHLTDSNVIPCQEPSTLTYCGQKRLENENHMTSERTTAPLEATTETSSGTALPSTVETTEQSSQPTTTEKHPCAGIDLRIWQNSSSLYACPKVSVTRLPRHDTYPGNCSAFLWCVNGKEYPSGRCAAGSHFTLNPEVCTWENSPDTFCNQSRRVKSCIEDGWNHTDFAASTTVNPTSFPSTIVNQYTCDNSTLQHLPTNDTYPDQCGKFQQCVNGIGHVLQCPDDAHFTLNGGLCISPTSPDTYCAQKKTASNG